VTYSQEKYVHLPFHRSLGGQKGLAGKKKIPAGQRNTVEGKKKGGFQSHAIGGGLDREGEKCGGGWGVKRR